VNAPRNTTISTGLSGVRYLRAATLLLIFLFLAVGFIIGVMRVANEYRQAIATAQHNALSTATMVQSHAGRIICETSLVAAGFADVYWSQLKSNSVDVEHLQHILDDRLHFMSQVLAFVLVKPDGEVVAAASRVPVPRGMNVFEASPRLRPPANTARNFVGVPFEGEHQGAPNRWVLPVGVRVGPDNGPAAGYAIAVVNINVFKSFYDTIDVGQNGHIALWTAGGHLVASSSGTEGPIGTFNSAIKEKFTDVANPLSKDIRVAGPVGDGESQINAEAKVDVLPMMIAVDLSSVDYLRSWRGTRNRMLTSAVGVVLAAMAFAGIILSQLQRARENEEALRNAKAVAKEANEAKSRFLAHMSHEFRTPLNAIMGFSDIIQNKSMGEPLAPVYATYASHIYTSGEHLLEIVNDVLDMAKIESGVQSLEVAPMAVSNAIEGAVGFLSGMAKASGLTVKTTVAPHLPLVTGDERFVRQVLINLLSNAIKFSPAHGQVRVRAMLTPEDHIDLSVVDHGPGIEPMILKRIGEPFLQGNPTLSRAGQGTGLGLSICKHYMELMGGMLIVESTLGVGTTVTMRFPKELRCEAADSANVTA